MGVRRRLLALALPVASTLVAVSAGGPDPATDVLEASSPSDQPSDRPPEGRAPTCGDLAVPPRPIRTVTSLGAVLATTSDDADSANDPCRGRDRLRSALVGLSRKLAERLVRLNAYVEAADLAYRREELFAARAFAEAAHREDPTTGNTKWLVTLGAQSERAKPGSAERRRIDEQWRVCCNELLEATRPPSSTVELPEDWIETTLTHAPRSVDDADEPNFGETRAAIVARLEAKRVEGFQLTDVNLDQAMTRLRDLTGLDFHLTPEARRTRFDEVRINIPELAEVSVRWILTDVVTQPFGLGWEVRDGVVTIGTSDEKRGELRLKYFDVKDLSPRIQSFRGSGPYLQPGSYIPVEDPDAAGPEAKLPGDALVETIKAVVDPDSWDRGGAHIDLKNGTLIVKNVRAAIERVGQLLTELRALPLRPGDIPPAHAVTATVYTIDWGVVDLVGNASIDGTVASADYAPSLAPFTPGAFVSALRAHVDEAAWLACDGKIELTAGTLTVRGGYGTVRRIDRAIVEMRARALGFGTERAEVVGETR